MNSGSYWAYREAGAFGPQESDDGPPAKTIPAVVVPGERFMREDGPNRWSVYDWFHPACSCLHMVPGGVGDVQTAEPTCANCGGTGNGPLEPEEYPVAADLTEQDARFLTFGAELLVAARSPIPSALPGGMFADDLGTIAGILDETPYPNVGNKLRTKAVSLRLAIAKAEAK